VVRTIIISVSTRAAARRREAVVTFLVRFSTAVAGTGTRIFVGAATVVTVPRGTGRIREYGGRAEREQRYG